MGGYGLLNPGTVAYTGSLITPLGQVGLSGYQNNWNFQWTTNAGGSGEIPLNDQDPAPSIESRVLAGINNAQNSYFTSEADRDPYYPLVGYYNPAYSQIDGLTIDYGMLRSGYGVYMRADYRYTSGTYYWYQTVETSNKIGGGGYGYFVDKDPRSGLPWYNSSPAEHYPGYNLMLHDTPRRDNFPSGLFYWRGESSLIHRSGNNYSEVTTFQWRFSRKNGKTRLYDLKFDAPSDKHKALILPFGIKIWWRR